MARKTVAAVAWLVVLLTPALAWGQNDQFVLLDTQYIHNTNTRAFSFFPLAPGVPDNWRSPVNYADGTIYMRLEVLSKPSANGVNYQICIFQDQHASANHACARYQFFTAPGLYTWSQSMPTLFQFNNLDWTRRMLDTMLVVKDKDGDPVDDRYGFAGAWEGSPNFSLYYPMEVKFTAIVVRQGGTFAPPAGWSTPGGSTTPPPPPPPGTPPPPPPTVPPGPGGNGGSPSPNGDRSINDWCTGGGAVAAGPRGLPGPLALGLLASLIALGARRKL
jgi:hypothetical protein